MSHDKSIKSGKEHRQPYRHGAAVDAQCRHQGSCPHCSGNRQYRNFKAKLKAAESIKDHEGNIK